MGCARGGEGGQGHTQFMTLLFPSAQTAPRTARRAQATLLTPHSLGGSAGDPGTGHVTSVCLWRGRWPGPTKPREPEQLTHPESVQMRALAAQLVTGRSPRHLRPLCVTLFEDLAALRTRMLLGLSSNVSFRSEGGPNPPGNNGGRHGRASARDQTSSRAKDKVPAGRRLLRSQNFLCDFHAGGRCRLRPPGPS